jgi:hypothetical protein
VVIVLRGVLTVVAAFVLGGLTSLGQQFLPEHLHSLSNSAGSWTAICFALLVLSRIRGWRAAGLGILVFIALNEGYGLVTRLKGFSYSILFENPWTIIAIVIGPIIGLAASWVQSKRPALVALGAAAPATVLVGEGIYGLLYVSDTTSPIYWTASIIVGAVFVIVMAIVRVRRVGWGLLSIVLTAIGAALFVLAYSGLI